MAVREGIGIHQNTTALINFSLYYFISLLGTRLKLEQHDIGKENLRVNV